MDHPETYGVALKAIHGFRMPLFFLVSGFFTTMMWRHRGVRGLVKHRTQRILLPLILGTIVLAPMINNMGRLAEYKKGEAARVDNDRGVAFRGNAGKSIWDAAKLGDKETIEKHLAKGARVDGQDDKQATPLHWAAGLGHAGAVRLLLERGADSDSHDGRKSTPLHWAAFMGQPATAQVLIENGATVDAKNSDGATPLDSTELDEGTTKYIANMLGIQMDTRKVLAARPQVAGLLGGGKDAPAAPAKAESIWDAAKLGDLDFISKDLSQDGDVDAREPLKRSTPLIIAALYGQKEAARLLIEKGANVKATNNDGDTALHSAAFFCHAEIVRLLLAKGADALAKNKRGDTPLSAVTMPWNATIEGIYRLVAGALQIDLDMERIKRVRPKIVTLLRADSSPTPFASIHQLYLAHYTVFGTFVLHHLWFLYDLIWLVAAFSLVALALDKLRLKPLPDLLVGFPGCLIWLLPLTCWPQYHMSDFGPDTAVVLQPAWWKLAYYAVFFGFGALCFGHRDFTEPLRRWWPLCFVAAVPALIFGLDSLEKHSADSGTYHPRVVACAVLYAWAVIFGFLGLFHRCFTGENPRIRYLSDASYWLYLAHLPLIQVIQIWVSNWPWPSLAKFLFVCLLTTGILLLAYEFIIRYTWVGILLNGKRTRESAPR